LREIAFRHSFTVESFFRRDIMAVEEQVKTVLEKNKQLIDDDPQKLNELVAELKREGLLIKKQYDLQPFDIIGRQLYRNAILEKSEKI
jgi:hypothetical protein